MLCWLATSATTPTNNMSHDVIQTHSLPRVQQQELKKKKKKKTHSDQFPVSNKAAEQGWSRPFDPKCWMCPDPLPPPSPASLLFTCSSLPVSPSQLLSFSLLRQIRCISCSWTHTARDNLEPGQTVHGKKTLGACFYPLGGVLAQQDARDNVWEEDELRSDSLGLKCSFPCVSTFLWVSGGGC